MKYIDCWLSGVKLEGLADRKEPFSCYLLQRKWAQSGWCSCSLWRFNFGYGFGDTGSRVSPHPFICTDYSCLPVLLLLSFCPSFHQVFPTTQTLSCSQCARAVALSIFSFSFLFLVLILFAVFSPIFLFQLSFLLHPSLCIYLHSFFSPLSQFPPFHINLLHSFTFKLSLSLPPSHLLLPSQLLCIPSCLSLPPSLPLPSLAS